MADYRKMYLVLIDAVERALQLLEADTADVSPRRKEAITELIRGELACEEIYIESEA
ncbi:MAG: hypothetical protein J6J83_01015 [Oscillospiraceae bacterium]|nr:hypothetical protein [Oscillospiraceae bacterium]